MKYLFFLYTLTICCAASSQDDIHASFYFSSHEKTRVPIGGTYHYHFTAFDSSNNILLFSADSLPNWLTYNNEKHYISGKATRAGQYFIDIAATNGKTKIYQRFMLTVYDKHTVNILCLGNSITNGVDKFNSYRRALWQLLHAANYNFDFIGSWSKHHWGTNVPNPDFDMDHEGHSGWAFSDMFHAPGWDSTRGNIKLWLKSYTPGIVLTELGTNDVFQCRKTSDILNDLSNLIGLLRKNNSHVKIFIAQIQPMGAQWAPKKLCGDSVSYAERINELNDALAAFAPAHTTAKSPLVVVDQYSGVNPKTDMFDDIHPNETGEKAMAKRWFDAIEKYLTRLP